MLVVASNDNFLSLKRNGLGSTFHKYYLSHITLTNKSKTSNGNSKRSS